MGSAVFVVYRGQIIEFPMRHFPPFPAVKQYLVKCIICVQFIQKSISCGYKCFFRKPHCTSYARSGLIGLFLDSCRLIHYYSCIKKHPP